MWISAIEQRTEWATPEIAEGFLAISLLSPFALGGRADGCTCLVFIADDDPDSEFVPAANYRKVALAVTPARVPASAEERAQHRELALWERHRAVLAAVNAANEDEEASALRDLGAAEAYLAELDAADACERLGLDIV